MTTFKEISGQLIRTLSSDPANPLEGQIWYNSTIGVLKGYKLVAAAWAVVVIWGQVDNFSWSRNSNSSFSFWWLSQQQQLLFLSNRRI
jgi:hypothetical protein